MSLTQDDLKAITDLAVQIATKELTETGQLTPVFIVGEPSGAIEVIAFDGVADEILNSARGKDVVFDAMRKLVKARGLTAVVFVAEAWSSKQTPKGAALPDEEFLEFIRERGSEAALRHGLMERREVIAITAQTPDGARTVYQEFMRDKETHAIVFGDRDESDYEPDEIRGRIKMFGNLRKENLG